MSKFLILGSGALGTAFGKLLTDGKKKDVSIFGIDKTEIEQLQQGYNTKYFPNSIKLPNFNATSDLAKGLKDCEYLILAIPSKTIPIVLENVKNNIPEGIKPLIVSGSKGFFPNTTISIHRGIEKFIKENKTLFRGVVSLVGPSFAIEITREQPTIISAVGSDKNILQEVQETFQNKYFKLYKQTDIDGADIGSAYKNVLAIAAGMAAELGYEINTISSLLTRGLNEMLVYTKATKGKIKTIMGLTGVGDLMLTAMSDKSRNRQFGREFIKKGKKAVDTKVTVEGLEALKFIFSIGQKKKLHLPIVYGLHEVIFGKLKPETLIKKLISGTNKFE